MSDLDAVKDNPWPTLGVRESSPRNADVTRYGLITHLRWVIAAGVKCRAWCWHF